MPSVDRSPARRIRQGALLLVPFVLSGGLVLSPASWRESVAVVLERSVFFPYRFAVGWGPRSLTAEWRRDRLARELADRRWKLDETLAAQAENARLRRLLGFRRRTGLQLVPAEVLGRERTRFGLVLTVQPSDPGAAVPGMAAIVPDGLLGQVRSRVGRYVRVECLKNLNVSLSVINQRSREGGILKWDPQRRVLALEGVPVQADWRLGDRVVTSGVGTLFPQGLIVGWVTGERAGERGLLKTVTVRPSADADRTEEIFLLAREEAESRGEAMDYLSPGGPESAARGVGTEARTEEAEASIRPSR